MGYTRIDNSLLESLYSTDLCGSELRVALFVLRQTTGWGMSSKYMTVSYIAKGTGLNDRTVKRDLKKLREKNILNFGMDKGVKNCLKECQKCHPPVSKMSPNKRNNKEKKIISKESPNGQGVSENGLQSDNCTGKSESEWRNDF